MTQEWSRAFAQNYYEPYVLPYLHKIGVRGRSGFLVGRSSIYATIRKTNLVARYDKLCGGSRSENENPARVESVLRQLDQDPARKNSFYLTDDVQYYSGLNLGVRETRRRLLADVRAHVIEYQIALYSDGENLYPSLKIQTAAEFALDTTHALEGVKLPGPDEYIKINGTRNIPLDLKQRTELLIQACREARRFNIFETLSEYLNDKGRLRPEPSRAKLLTHDLELNRNFGP